MNCTQILCILAAVLSAGCSVAPQTRSAGNSDSIEYISDFYKTRILLIAGGGARFDTFSMEHDGPHITHTVLLPAGAQEIDRLARIIASMDGSAVTEPLHYSEMRLLPDATEFISCGYAGHTYVLRAGQHHRTLFHVFDGIVAEIETIAMSNLALAIHQQEDAEKSLASGDKTTGLNLYCKAIASFRRWQTDWMHRYEVGDDFMWRFGKFDSLELSLTDRADHYRAVQMSRPGSDPQDVLIKAAQMSWQDTTEHWSIKYSRNATIVDNLQDNVSPKQSGNSGLIPPNVVNDLLDSPLAPTH